jgi:hypothetical protein
LVSDQLAEDMQRRNPRMTLYEVSVVAVRLLASIATRGNTRRTYAARLDKEPRR